jgi:hypothetical protein
MRLGAIHRPAPPAIRPLAERASLSLMTAPASCDWHAACPADGDMLGNDRFGDCVPVAELRAIQMRRAVVGRDAWKPAAARALELYEALTGFNPATGQPDRGTDTALAMQAWCASGVWINSQDVDVVRWASVDPARLDHTRLAVAHTGPVQVTLALPLAAQDVAVWAEAPGFGPAWAAGSWGCHRVICGKYDAAGLTVRTWGQDVPMSLPFWRAFVVAVDAALSREWLDTTGLAPSGLDWAALQADMEALQES